MFFAANHYGSEILSTVFHTLAIPSDKRLKVTAKFLDVTEATLTKWLTGKSSPPRAVVYALWHESHVGRATTAAHSAEGERLARAQVKGLESNIVKMQATINTLNLEIDAMKRDSVAPHAMNESFFKRG